MQSYCPINKIRNILLNVRMAPRQTYSRCTAQVDPIIAASLPNPARCSDLLRSEYGVVASHNSETGAMVLEGNMLQLQLAQTRLEELYRELQLQQQQELDNITLQRLENVDSPRLFQQRSRTSGTRRAADDSDKSSVTSVQSLPAIHFVDSRGKRSKTVNVKADKARTTSLKISGKAAPLVAERGSKLQTITGEDVNATSSTGNRPAGDSEQCVKQTAHVVHAAGDSTKSYLYSSSSGSHHSLPGKQDFLTMGTDAMMSTSLQGKPTNVQSDEICSKYADFDLNLDPLVLSYILEIQKDEVQKMKDTNQVDMHHKELTDADQAVVSFAPSATLKGSEDFIKTRLQQAQDSFVALYQSIFYSVIRECINFDIGIIESSDFQAIVHAVRVAFKEHLVLRDDTLGSITLVGTPDQVSLAAQWMREKLHHDKAAMKSAEKPSRLEDSRHSLSSTQSLRSQSYP